MDKIVIFSGAGLSAESGIPTFRDSDGLWHERKIEDVATPIGWMRNPSLVLDFYARRFFYRALQYTKEQLQNRCQNLSNG